MIKNYFKIAFRNLFRNKGLSFINLVGLASGFAITLLIFQYTKFEKSYENTHPNADRIVRLTLNYLTGETITTQDCEVYPAAGPRITNDLSEVETYSRVFAIGEPYSPMQIGDEQYLMENLYAVDASFFKMFNYRLIHGSEKDIFIKPNEAVITESTALKYFNRTDVVGEVIKSPGDDNHILYNVVGVTKDSPLNTHLKFDMLISYPTMTSDPEMLNRYREKENNWDNNNSYMYVMLANEADYNRFTTNLKTVNQKIIDEKKIKSEEIIGQKIADIHLNSQKTFEPETNGDAGAVFFLLAVALLIIISAFVNYINLTTSQALDRAKEVGVKKVLGSTKAQLRIQFLVESLIMNLLASVLAVIFVFIGKSTFISISGLPESFSFIGNFSFWLPLIVFILIGGLLSGLYPAFVLSSFKPSSILKGDFSHSLKGAFLRKSLVVFQFAITIILLIQTFTVNEQIEFLRGMERGVDVEQNIVIEAPIKNANQNYSVFKERLLANSNVKTVSLSTSVPGQSVAQLSTTAGIVISGTTPDKYHNFYLTFIDKDYMPLLGVDLLSGTNFNDGGNAAQRQVIVNEEALKRWNITKPEDAVGKKLAFWGGDWEIKGVAKNYHQQSPKQPLLPMIHIYSTSFRSLATVQFTGGLPSNNLALVKEKYASIYPGAPFSYFFMDQEYDKQFKAEDRFKDVFMVLTCFSILIACLGLLGLASFSVAKRKKEIGIRKVVGASTAKLLFLLSKDFLKTVIVSVIISVPLTYLLIKNWLRNFAYKIDIDIWLFVMPILLVLVMVLISISFKTIKAAIANPIDSLRSE